MKSKKIIYPIWFLVVFLFDRITKYLALGLLKPYVVTQFLSFQLVFNRGISWGMLHSNRQGFFVLLTLCIIAIIGGLAYHTYQRYVSGRSVYAECAVVAGALSNVVDRIIYQGVIDFIHVHIDTWSWPIFNIADAAIVIGICWMIKEYYKEL